MAKSVTDININEDEALSIFVDDITQALIAVNSSHTSSTAPTYNVEEGMKWLDTSSADHVLKMYIGGSWVTLLDETGGVFTTLGGNNIKVRLDNNDNKHNGSVQSSPDFQEGQWAIDGVTITVTEEEFNYLNTTTGDIQTSIDQTETPYTHPTTDGNVHVPTGGATNQILKYASAGTAQWKDPDPAQTSASITGQAELKIVTVEITYAPIIYRSGHSGSPSTTVRRATINLSKQAIMYPTTAISSYYNQYVNQGNSSDYFPAYVATPTKYVFAPEFKVEPHPYPNYIGTTYYDWFKDQETGSGTVGSTLETFQYIDSGGYTNTWVDTGYVNPSYLTSPWGSYDFDSGAWTTGGTQTQNISLETKDGYQVVVRQKFIVDSNPD